MGRHHLTLKKKKKTNKFVKGKFHTGVGDEFEKYRYFFTEEQVNTLYQKMRVLCAHISGNLEDTESPSSAGESLFHYKDIGEMKEVCDRGKELVKSIKANNPLSLKKCLDNFNSETLSAVIKLTFQSGSKPIVPANITKDFVKCFRDYSCEKSTLSLEDLVRSVQKIATESISAPVRGVVQALCGLFEDCTSPNSSERYKLAYYFGPLLFLPKHDMLESRDATEQELTSMYRLIAASNDAVELLELMITHNAIIFRKGAKVENLTPEEEICDEVAEEKQNNTATEKVELEKEQIDDKQVIEGQSNTSGKEVEEETKISENKADLANEANKDEDAISELDMNAVTNIVNNETVGVNTGPDTDPKTIENSAEQSESRELKETENLKNSEEEENIIDTKGSEKGIDDIDSQATKCEAHEENNKIETEAKDEENLSLSKENEEKIDSILAQEEGEEKESEKNELNMETKHEPSKDEDNELDAVNEEISTDTLNTVLETAEKDTKLNNEDDATVAPIEVVQECDDQESVKSNKGCADEIKEVNEEETEKAEEATKEELVVDNTEKSNDVSDDKEAEAAAQDNHETDNNEVENEENEDLSEQENSIIVKENSVIDTNGEEHEFNAVVRFYFPPREYPEIELIKGQRVAVLKTYGEGWWSGITDTGASGWFPSSYLTAPENLEEILPFSDPESGSEMGDDEVESANSHDTEDQAKQRLQARVVELEQNIAVEKSEKEQALLKVKSLEDQVRELTANITKMKVDMSNKHGKKWEQAYDKKHLYERSLNDVLIKVNQLEAENESLRAKLNMEIEITDHKPIEN